MRITPLNLGEEVARDTEIALDDYRQAIRSGLQFLHDNARTVRVRNPDTFARGTLADAVHTEALAWKPGIFFASTFRGLPEWRSEAYTTAIVLEAFSGYALAFDLHSEDILGIYRLSMDERTFELDLVHKM